MPDPKNEQNNPNSQQNKGSGSDTVSAAKISAGTSVGNVGQSPPMPGAQGGAANPGQANAGKGAGAGTNPPQSSTLASHTSTPLGGASADKDQKSGPAGQGGQAGMRDQKTAAGQGGQSQAGQQGRQGGGQQAQGASEAMKRSAEEVRERADEAYDDAKEWMHDTYESAASWASEKLGGRSGRGYGGSRGMGARGSVQQYVAQNPVMVGLVGLAAGLLLGALLPRTRRENQMFGEWADEVREQGLRYAHEMTQRGREYVEGGFSGEDERFSKHESEFGRGPGADRSGTGANRH